MTLVLDWITAMLKALGLETFYKGSKINEFLRKQQLLPFSNCACRSSLRTPHLNYNLCAYSLLILKSKETETVSNFYTIH